MPTQSEIGKRRWGEFFTKCLTTRAEFSSFKEGAEELDKRSPLEGRSIIDLLLQSSHLKLDPRLTMYVEVLLKSGKVKIEDVLGCTFALVDTAANAQDTAMSNFDGARGIAFIRLLIDEVSENGSPKTRLAAMSIMKSLIPWLSMFQRSSETPSMLAEHLLDIGDTLGQFIATFFNSIIVQGILGGQPPKGIKASFARYLPSFTSLLSQSNVQLANTLDYLQKQAGLHGEVDVEQPLNDGVFEEVDMSTLSYQENVPDTPFITTRAGLYVYTNAMLTGRPLTDDAAIFDYLSARYNGDVATLVIDFITASFDTLQNYINRPEPERSITLLRSFLVNKLPTILNYYSAMMYEPLTVEACITQALERIGAAAFSSFTQTFGVLPEARQDFLFACALHQLIPEQSIERLLGDVPMQNLPECGRHAKANLVIQCAANPGKIQDLIGDLENMDGNVGEIVGALIEIIQTLCISKDSMTLKSICNTLSQKPQTLDVMMLFAQPITLLQPLCQLLDQWQAHEDQGEQHPVYDEFGSVFLLVLVMQHHFNLQEYDLGISDANSFVFRYLRESHASHELNAHENDLLGHWIMGLFLTEGINDELMSTCSPKDFHLLVTTLFEQSLRACQAGKLGLETLKGGFEYLLEPFLLPSLVSGLGWFTRRLWEIDRVAPGLDTLLPVLQALIKPPSISGESASLHATVLSIVSKPLQRSLAHVQKLHPRRADTEPLLSTLKRHVQPQCHVASSHTELEAWTSTPSGGIPTALRQSLQSLTQWSSTGSLDAPPPGYTHRLPLAAIRMLGAKAVLTALIDEIVEQQAAFINITTTASTTTSTALINTIDILLDITASLISAPSATDPASINPLAANYPKPQLSLRDALQADFNDAYRISKTDAPRAAIIVRLFRRVTAQTARSAQQENIVSDVDADQMLLDLNQAAAVGDGTAVGGGMGGGVGGRGEGAGQSAGGTDIDNVVAGVMEEIETQEFLAGSGSFMGM